MNSRIARRYTLALYEECLKNNKVDIVSADLESIRNLISENRKLFLFFRSPVISKRKKNQVIKKLFGSKVDDLVVNFISLLIDRSRENIFSDIIKDFLDYKDAKKGVVRAHISSAVKLDENIHKGILKSLEKYSGMKCKPVFELDKDLIGGFRVKFNDIVLDASIKRQLELLKNKFKKSSLTKV
jgi:F-type H+-transporting ATPase subunit delta